MTSKTTTRLIAVATVVLAIVGSTVSAILTDLQKKQILAAFNKARATTTLPAANMKILDWDERIAQQMQTYTDFCNIDWEEFDDPPSYFFYRDHAPDPVGVANWRTNRMAPYYDYETGGCTNTSQSKKNCMHPEIYERGIVADLETVGCGVTRCGPGNKGVFHACALGGRSGVTRHPFIIGERCSQCPTGWDYCIKGLCSKVEATPEPTPQPIPTKVPTSYPTRRRRRRRGKATKSPSVAVNATLPS